MYDLLLQRSLNYCDFQAESKFGLDPSKTNFEHLLGKDGLPEPGTIIRDGQPWYGYVIFQIYLHSLQMSMNWKYRVSTCILVLSCLHICCSYFDHDKNSYVIQKFHGEYIIIDQVKLCGNVGIKSRRKGNGQRAIITYRVPVSIDCLLL